MTPPGELVTRIRDEIRKNGPVSFERFMERALYEPDLGYYASSAERIGRRGDFFTASDVGPAFGSCLARQLVEIDRSLERPETFHVLEFAAGRGLLARDLIDALTARAPDLAARLDYRMVDRSAAMREVAAGRVPEATATAPGRLHGGHVGCVIAVELFDALPVRRFRRVAGELVEIHVGLDNAGELCELELPASPEVVEWAATYGAAAEEGMEAEACPGLRAQIAQMAAVLDRGAMLIFDYGDPAERLYHTDRARGTLLAYHGHATNEDYLQRVGLQDLTAHVNFSALEREASRLGLTVLGTTTQDRFLIGNGILDEFEQTTLAEARDPGRVKRRLQAMQLIHPGGMGRMFKVLGLGCHGPDPWPLGGFSDPFGPGPPGP